MILYQAIKNFILVKAICRKYRLRYKPFCGLNFGEYNYIHNFIQINPFNPEFESVLFHEVGHHIHNKIVNYHTFFELNPDSVKGVVYDVDQDFHKLLVAEAFASRFALKTGRADKAVLARSFITYTQYPFSIDPELSTRPWFARYVDCISRNSLRITNI